MNKIANTLKIKISPKNMTSNSDKINFSFINRILDANINNYSDKDKEKNTDNEINFLKFKEELNKDKRALLSSLLRAEHLLIISFYTNNDYIPRIIKIIFFILIFFVIYC